MILKNLHKTQEFFSKRGYKSIDVPWMVTKPVLDCTNPGKNNLMVEGKNKGLIASGESGFLYLLTKGYLPCGKYQTITPCFREEEIDFFHRKQFLKLELIIVLKNEKNPKDCLDNMVAEALGNFSGLCNDKPVVKQVEIDTDRWVKEEHLVDILMNGKEIGSYGIRHYEHLSWVFGTGLAEPRFSNTIKE